MSGNFGIGIGSFMAGIEKGKEAARAANAADAATAQQAFQNDLATKNMEMAQDANDRAGDASQLALAQGNQTLSQGATTFGNAQADRTAMQPIVDATRAAKLGTLQGDAAVSDAQERARRTPGRNMTRSRQNPSFLARTPRAIRPIPSTANRFPRKTPRTNCSSRSTEREWPIITMSQPEKVSRRCLKVAMWIRRRRSARRMATRISSAASTILAGSKARRKIGNWDGVNEHLNNILGNSGYINSANHDATATPILGPDGRATGMTVHTKTTKLERT